MDKFLQKSFLGANCDGREEVGYMRQFTPEQIVEMKDSLSETAIKINDFEIQKKEFLSEMKAETEPLTAQKKALLKNIKQKAEFVTENCFKFLDRDEKKVGFYNAEGMLVSERPMRADEYQLTIPMGMTGTDK